MASVKKNPNIRWEREGAGYRITWGDLTVCVHKYIGCGDQLFVSCHSIGITQVPLSMNGAEARTEALRYVESYLQQLLKAANALMVRVREPK